MPQMTRSFLRFLSLALLLPLAHSTLPSNVQNPRTDGAPTSPGGFELVPVQQSRAAIVASLAVLMSHRRHNASLLELGCGDGAVVDFLPATLRAHYTGADASASGFQEEWARRGPPSRFVEASAQSMLLDYSPLASFDVIILSETLHGMDFRSTLSRYVSRHLKPGGALIIALQRTAGAAADERMFDHAASLMYLNDEVSLSGYAHDRQDGKKFTVDIKVYRKI